MVAEPELSATAAQSQVAASRFPDRKENGNAAQTVIDAGEWAYQGAVLAENGQMYCVPS